MAFRLEPGKGSEPENFRGGLKRPLKTLRMFWICLKALAGTDKIQIQKYVGERQNYSGVQTPKSRSEQHFATVRNNLSGSLEDFQEMKKVPGDPKLSW